MSKKNLLLTSLFALCTSLAFSQSDKFWSANKEDKASIVTDKAVARVTYPKLFRLYNLNTETLRKELFSVVGTNASVRSTVITLPNADGGFEQFEVFEASNFEPELQARFPEIRAYSGRGITDKYATLKLSISPQGIQTMVFRTDKENEFIEPYSKDHTVYSVYRSNRNKGQLAWTCSTDEKNTFVDINAKIGNTSSATGSSTGQLKTMRLAQSCNGEYANYFGATSAAQEGLVLAAYNATLTRCNGVYERDLALHLNLIANTTAVIFYNPATDPYSTTLSQWNLQLQQTLTSVIGNANYDIGHMFGASGGGGNAGCIGCVCVNPATNNSLAKGAGITSPFDAIPQGDNFDIDYVAHEVGHQLGANHTFSMSLEGTGVNKEVGSGITVMGYAGITSQDVAPHSIDIFHQASIAQIQANLATKTCPVSITMTANHAPVVAAVSNYTIPISTPFALTASATDPENDPLTYCWEQNDNSTVSGASSVASPTKASGPNWLSFPATVSGTRTFPKLSTILAGLNVTPPLPGGDAGANIEALSSVSRTLNFRVTARDNNPYVAGSTIGQTAFTDAVVTVTNTAGPFAVTSPNTAINWSAGGNATVTWSVNGTNAGSVNCATVNILLSTDGGQTFPTVLAAATVNDGSEVITVPSSEGTTNRIKVESVGNIFFDISNTNFTIGPPALCGDATGLTASAITQTGATVSWTAVSGATSYDVDYKTNASSTWTNAATATTTTSVNLTGLTAGTLYDWRVRATCPAGAGNYVQAQFTTTAPPVTCPGIYDVSTNGTTAGAALIPFNTDIKGLLSPSGDNDYYRFVITTGGTITMTLTTLPANYHLRLLNSAGTTLQTSSNSGTNNETITRTVTPGTYYARVYPQGSANNATNCYTLRVQLGTASRGLFEMQYVSNDFTVSPNPAANMANLAFNAEKTGTATISITDRTGNIVFQNTTSVQEGENRKNLDVSRLSNGMYFVKIQMGDDIQLSKIVVMK
ncbi:MAG: T9SS type A sorting domain-containing protein [Ferruginibacter sp.]|nr:T9SS type A sorting domain-containing protein [Ferruginibacter sp.]